MEDMRIKLTDGRDTGNDIRPEEPLVMVPLYWLEKLIRESEKYWNTVTDADVLGIVENLQKSVEALQEQVDVQHNALVALKGTIEGTPEKSEADPGEKCELDKMSEKEGKASKNPEKVTPEPEKCTEISKKRPRPTKKDPEEAGKKRVDDGKIRALYEGRWSVKDIASEMKLSDQTIYNHLKAMGLMP